MSACKHFQRNNRISPGKAIGIAAALIIIIVFAAASSALLPKLSWATAAPALYVLRTDGGGEGEGNTTESEKGLAAMAKGNKEMVEVMRQQVNDEANELV